MTYPKYHKATDPSGKVTALLCQENANAITIVAKQGARFLVQQVGTWDDVAQTIGGQFSPCENDLYNDTLYKDWNFRLSDVVLHADAPAGAPVLEANESVTIGAGTTTEPSSDFTFTKPPGYVDQVLDSSEGAGFETEEAKEGQDGEGDDSDESKAA